MEAHIPTKINNSKIYYQNAVLPFELLTYMQYFLSDNYILMELCARSVYY